MGFSYFYIISTLVLLNLTWYLVCGQTHTYTVGQPCTTTNPCFYPDMCISNAPTVSGIVCSCRLAHMRSNMTWRTNFTDCTTDYSPWGTHPRENGVLVDAPAYEYERVRESAFTTNGAYQDSFLARYARLFANENRKGGWCAPTAPIVYSTEEYWLMIDLGNITKVSTVISQGRTGVSIAFAVTKFTLEYATDNVTFTMLMNSTTGAPKIFDGNTDNDGLTYNFITPHLIAQYLRITPVEFINLKCMRIEILGMKIVNECVNGWNQCDSKAACTDTLDSYYCTCPAGYRDFFGNGFVCVQVNECIERRPEWKHNCSVSADCTDLLGSFRCDCHSGYHGDGYYCEDTNECTAPVPAVPGYWCKPLADCINTVGSYECRCKTGYTGKPESCRDVNECKDTNNCSPDAACTNTIGSYICTCRNGYAGDGYQCSDINECLSDPCHKQAVCGNTPGSYSCICKPGFRGSGRWCEDINECLNGGVCRADEKCYNFDGGYVCQCPKEMAQQRPYVGTERDILDRVLSNFRGSAKQDWKYPLDYHAHMVRAIYEMVLRTYSYHFKEVTYSFFISKVAGNDFSVELYDMRCTDVANTSFPNHCHEGYKETVFDDFTDVVDMYLVEKPDEPFENWATAPPPTPAKLDAATSPGTTVTTLSTPAIPTRIVNVNGTNMTQTFPPPTAPPPFRACGGNLSGVDGGRLTSPNYPSKYPPNAYCVWTIEAPEYHSVYVRFTFFEMEESKNCFYDNLEIRDESETGEVKARYCGLGTLYKPAVRSGRRTLVLILFSDLAIDGRGFVAEWRTLKPRVSLTCITYNQMSSMPLEHVKVWKDEIENEKDKSQFVPVSRLMACKQYPRCNHTRPGDVIFTFEHIRDDRNVKKCVHWMLDKIGTSFSTRPCDLVKTNKTHTVCSCHTWGIVAVLGKFAKWQPDAAPTLFELGRNSFLSILLVTFALLFTLIYLFLKDQWGAVVMEVFTMKEYDSGRIIQMHIVFNTLLAEIFFSIITFNITPDAGSCFFTAFVFYYLLQTVFFWLFIYAVFLQSRVAEVFDSEKYNSYKIYLFVGYGLPFIVTLTVSGLSFKSEVDEKICWLLFQGSTVWGFSGVIVTLGLGSLALLVATIYASRNMENGILLQEKCIRTVFTQFFVLLTSVFGAFALQDRSFFAEYCFSLCNLLQGFSIAIMYCILKREDPIIKANQIGPLPDWGDGSDKKYEDFTPEFKDMESDAERSGDEDEEDADKEKDDEVQVEETPTKRYKHVKDGSTIFLQLRKKGDTSDGEEEEVGEGVIQGVGKAEVLHEADEASIDEPPKVQETMSANVHRFLIQTGSDGDESDQEIDFRFDEIDELRRGYGIEDSHV